MPDGQTNNQDLTDLVAGTYTVMVMDDNDCPFSLEFPINEPTGMEINLDEDESLTELLCYGDPLGTLDISVTGGTPDSEGEYEYTWSASNGGVVPDGQINNQDLTDLVAGTYTVVVMDDNDCTAELPLFINQPPTELTVAIDDWTEMLDCYQGFNGSINITPCLLYTSPSPRDS